MNRAAWAFALLSLALGVVSATLVVESIRDRYARQERLVASESRTSEAARDHGDSELVGMQWALIQSKREEPCG